VYPEKSIVVFLEKENREEMADLVNPPQEIILTGAGFPTAVFAVSLERPVAFVNQSDTSCILFCPDKIQGFPLVTLQKHESYTRSFGQQANGVNGVPIKIFFRGSDQDVLTLVVCPTPFHQVIENGKHFMFDHLFKGNYLLHAWSPNFPLVTQSLSVEVGEITQTKIHLSPDLLPGLR